MEWMHRLGPRLLALAVLGLALAGCDKCGNRVKINVPSIPNACTADNAPS